MYFAFSCCCENECFGCECSYSLLGYDVSSESQNKRRSFAVSEELSGYRHLPAKTKQSFDHVSKRYINDFDWFMKTDDDTYVIVEHLLLFLASQNTFDPVFFGHHLKPFVESQGCVSGGARGTFSARKR